MIAIRKLYHTGQDNRSGWSPSATLQHYGKTAGVHTFYWNGTPTGESYDTNYLPEGTYTFEVTANQADENLCLNCNGIPPEPPCTAGDKETYRSEYLKIVRASDESGNPICDVEYDGYDDNGTPEDESDDKYIYVIRKYVLKDSLGVNASAGVIWLYDPEGEMVHDWNIAEQDCIIHNARDGLHATAAGLEHALRIRVPVEKMPYGGTYRFVLHIRDAHAELYRRGGTEGRWALDLNGDGRLGCVAIWATGDYPLELRGHGEKALSYLKRIYEPQRTYISSPPPGNIPPRKSYVGYLPHPPPGDPAKGGSGLLKDKSARLTIRTLNRLCPVEAASHPEYSKYLTKNAVWGYYGHGTEPGGDRGLAFNGGDNAEEVSSAQEDAQKQIYDIYNFGLGHVRFAMLMACYSAGGTKGTATIPEHDSIARLFCDRGAQCALGFYNRVYPMRPSFKTWNELFWRYLCGEGMTVRSAATRATAEASKGLDVRVFGNGETILWPTSGTP